MSKVWRYVQKDSQIFYQHQHFAGIHFENDWIRISDGFMSIKNAYAWDGCSPSIKIKMRAFLPKGLWLGVWDGPRGDDCRPVGWRASLFHDALCQFRKDIKGLTKEKTVEIFKQMLIEDAAPKWMSFLYPAAVSMFGPQDWK